MTNHLLTFPPKSLRGTDSNSLLRLYDQVSAIFNGTSSLPERARAEKAIQRITDELAKRNVRP